MSKRPAPTASSAALKKSPKPTTTFPPVCSICLNLPREPIHLPCKCASTLCFQCFSDYLASSSKCLICREMLLPKLRRVCPSGDYASLIDQALWAAIQADCAEELESGPKLDAVKPVPPEPGELALEAQRLMQKHLEERSKEEQANLAYLESLKKEGDEDLLLLDRLSQDEQLAKTIQQNEAPPPAPSGVVVRAAAATSLWTCSQCTFRSSTALLRCQVCGSPKNFPRPPSAAAASPRVRALAQQQEHVIDEEEGDYLRDRE